MRNKKKIRAAALLAVIALILGAICLGVWFFEAKRYDIISIAVALLSCLPFYLRFERGRGGAAELAVVAVMSAFSVVGRLIFYPIPAFKPVTAITVISGMALGPESGFMIGSLSAVISNIFFGQGPWTPFQMLIWGLIGALSGVAFYGRKRIGAFALTVTGILSGVAFSLIMDVWTVMFLDGGLPTLSRYLATVAASLPMMAIYAVSNVVFLLLLCKPFLKKLERLKNKYGIFAFDTDKGGSDRL